MKKKAVSKEYGVYFVAFGSIAASLVSQSSERYMRIIFHISLGVMLVGIMMSIYEAKRDENEEKDK